MVVGMTVMRKANVVIRDLSALEALGGITNICSDKTGTLTQGAMIVKKVWIPRVGVYTVKNSTNPSNPTQGEVTKVPEPIPNTSAPDDRSNNYRQLTFDVPAATLAKDQQMKKHVDNSEDEAELTPELEEFLRPTVLCNLATVLLEKTEGGRKEKWQTTGEPTEIALQVFARRFDFGKKKLESEGWKQVAEFPFDSSIKRMSVVYRDPDTKESIIYTKGAVERVLDLCSSIGTGSNIEAMTDDLKEFVIAQMDELAGQGQRVLAVASRTWDGDFPEQHGSNVDQLRGEVEQDLTLIGLVGIYDPPRDETKDAIRECSEAGIKVHMLTVRVFHSLISY
jgi:Na+-exporting ATPase